MYTNGLFGSAFVASVWCAILIMDWKTILVLLIINFNIATSEMQKASKARGHSPFFWQPKLTLTLIKPGEVHHYNMFVLLRGYKLSITTMSLIECLPERHRHWHLNPLKATFYTDAYRWFKRYVSLLPMWFYGEGGHYDETLKLWRARFMYADSFVPSWIQRLLFFIPAEDWERERLFFTRFTEYAGDTYAKQMRFNDGSVAKPMPNWLASHESKESEEGVLSTTVAPTTVEAKTEEQLVTTLAPYVGDEDKAPWNWTWGRDLTISTTAEPWYHAHAPWKWDWKTTTQSSNEKGERPDYGRNSSSSNNETVGTTDENGSSVTYEPDGMVEGTAVPSVTGKAGVDSSSTSNEPFGKEGGGTTVTYSKNGGTVEYDKTAVTSTEPGGTTTETE